MTPFEDGIYSFGICLPFITPSSIRKFSSLQNGCDHDLVDKLSGLVPIHFHRLRY